jgi:hypothetical protein
MKKFKQVLLSLMPGIFLIGYNIRTGSLTAMSKAGASFGCDLLWAVLLSGPGRAADYSLDPPPDQLVLNPDFETSPFPTSWTNSGATAVEGLNGSTTAARLHGTRLRRHRRPGPAGSSEKDGCGTGMRPPPPAFTSASGQNRKVQKPDRLVHCEKCRPAARFLRFPK